MNGMEMSAEFCFAAAAVLEIWDAVDNEFVVLADAVHLEIDVVLVVDQLLFVQ